MNCPLRRLTAGLLVLSLATTAHAELIGHSLPTDRERIAAYLDRKEVSAELVRHGIARENAKARVAALADAEAAALAGRIAAAPAGGYPLGVVLIAATMSSGGLAILGGLVVLAVAIPVGIVAGVKYMAKHGTNTPDGYAPEAAGRTEAPARPAKTTTAARPWKATMASSPFPPSTYGSFVPAPVIAASPAKTTIAPEPFPVSTGLYGSFVPAPVHAAPTQASAQ